MKLCNAEPDTRHDLQSPVSMNGRLLTVETVDLPRDPEQVVQQPLVLLGLGSLPPRVLVEGEDAGAAPVPAPGQHHQLLLHLPRHVHAPEAAHQPRRQGPGPGWRLAVVTVTSMAAAAASAVMVVPETRSSRRMGVRMTSGVHVYIIDSFTSSFLLSLSGVLALDNFIHVSLRSNISLEGSHWK